MKAKKSKDQGFLGRLSILSALVLLGADIVATPGDVANATGLLLILGVAYTMVIAFIGGMLIFLNEWVTTKDFYESLVEGAICGFLIMIPTPVVGVIVAAISILTRLRILSL